MMAATIGEVVRMAVKLKTACVDAVYCLASLKTISRLRGKHIWSAATSA